jgi:phosphoglycerate dehydrogenase-like enzyme
MRLLHIAAKEVNSRLFTDVFRQHLAAFGELTIVEQGSELPRETVLSTIRSCDILLTGWGHLRVPTEIATDRGRLRYICHLTGEMRWAIPIEIIRAGIPVTNWGDAPAFQIAEGAMTLLLACLKNLRSHIVEKQGGYWYLRTQTVGSLRGLRLGMYGYGAIARQFVELCRPFQSRLAVYDPYTDTIPEDITRYPTLNALFTNSDVVVCHAALTSETRHSIGAEQLALLREGGILINTARGGLIDQEALFAELKTGRLRAGLDVLDGDDKLPPDHPARQWANVIFTSHEIGQHQWAEGESLSSFHEVCLDNLRCFTTGEPLRFCMDEIRYERST